MKTKAILLLLVFFALMCGKTQAQAYTPFPDSNAVWNILYFSNFYPDSAQYHTKLYGLIDDTIINTVKYNKLYFNDGLIDSIIEVSSSNTSYLCAIRQDTFLKKVYFIPKDSINELIFYDFSINVGDTFFVYNEIGNKVKAWCIGLGPIVVSGKIRNVFSIRSDNILWGFHSYIEGVGNYRGLFLNYYPVPNETTLIKCLTVNDSLYYEYDGNPIWGINIDTSYYKTCYNKGVNIFTDISLLRDYTDIVIIYPNPLIHSSLISLPDNSKLNNITIDVFDLQGNSIKILKDIKTHQNVISRDYFSAAGMYFIRIISDNFIETIKLVVQ